MPFPRRGVRRPLTAAVLVVLLAAITAAASPADGDPASDYLLTQNVYLPYQAPSPAVSAALEQRRRCRLSARRARQGRGDLRRDGSRLAPVAVRAAPRTTRTSSGSSLGSGTSARCWS